MSRQLVLSPGQWGAACDQLIVVVGEQLETLFVVVVVSLLKRVCKVSILPEWSSVSVSCRPLWDRRGRSQW